MSIIDKVKILLENKPESMPIPRTDEEREIHSAYKLALKGKAPKPAEPKPQPESKGNILTALAQAIEPPCPDPFATLRAIGADMRYDTPELSAAKKSRDEAIAAEAADQKLMDALGRDKEGARFSASKAAGVPEVKAAARQREAGERQAIRVRMYARRMKCAEICLPVVQDFRAKAGIWIDAKAAAEREQCKKFKITYQPSPLVSGMRLALRAIDDNKVIRDNPDANALLMPSQMLPFV